MTTATTTNGAKTFTMTVKYDANTMTLTGSDRRGARTLAIDLNRAKTVWTDAEATLVNETKKCGDAGDEFCVDFTVAELKALAGLRDRAVAAAAVTVESAKTAAHVAAMAQREAVRNSRGMDVAEREVNSLDRIAKTLSGDVYKLTYDIPKALNDECPSPCGLLWSIGAFPASESDWVIREDDLNRAEVQEMIQVWKDHATQTNGQRGVKYWLVRYHPDDLHIVRQQAIDALDARVRALKLAIVENIISADNKLTEAQKALDAREQPATEKERVNADRARDNRVRAILNSAWSDLRDVVTAAGRFEESDSVAEVIAGLRQTIAAQAKAFNALMVTKYGAGAEKKMAPVS